VDESSVNSDIPEGYSRTSAYPDRVPRVMKMFYAIGASSETIIGVAFNSFNFFFYTNLMGLPGTLAGLSITIGLVIDAITDPLIGSLSDRWKSKLGRRHPFMFVAPIPVMVCLFLIYSPPDNLEQTGLFLWLTGLVVLMRSSMTLFHVPHLALGAELSSDFTERTRVMSINMMFAAIAGAATYFLGMSYFSSFKEEYGNGLLNTSAYPALAVTAAILGGLVMLASTILTLKLVPRLPQPPGDIPRFSMLEFFHDAKSAVQNRNYFYLLIGYLLLSATLGTRATVDVHMNTYYWELLPGQLRYFGLGLLIGPIIGAIVTARLHQKFDKKPTIISALIFLCLFSSAPVMLRITGLFPENGSPLLFPCLFGIYVLWSSAGMILLVSVMSALADIADEHELTTGRRQEGIFYAARSFFAKASSGLGHLLAGIAIDLIKFPAGAEPGTIDADIVFKLGLVDGPIAVIPGLIAISFYLQYNLTRERHSQIQEELRQRHSSG
jgi:GPH family glycoside/pentoside/hexuronide:cation symporter